MFKIRIDISNPPHALGSVYKQAHGNKILLSRGMMGYRYLVLLFVVLTIYENGKVFLFPWSFNPNDYLCSSTSIHKTRDT